MSRIENFMFKFYTQPAWVLLSGAVAVVVMAARYIFRVEVIGVLGGCMLSGWILSGCFFLERKLCVKFKIKKFIYLVSFVYMGVTPYFLFGDSGFSEGISYLYGVLLSFFVIYHAYLVAKIGKNEASALSVILRSIMFFLGIVFYPAGIWFIQPRIIGFLGKSPE